MRQLSKRTWPPPYCSDSRAITGRKYIWITCLEKSVRHGSRSPVARPAVSASAIIRLNTDGCDDDVSRYRSTVCQQNRVLGGDFGKRPWPRWKWTPSSMCRAMQSFGRSEKAPPGQAALDAASIMLMQSPLPPQQGRQLHSDQATADDRDSSGWLPPWTVRLSASSYVRKSSARSAPWDMPAVVHALLSPEAVYRKPAPGYRSGL